MFSYFLSTALGAAPALKAPPGFVRDASIYVAIVLFVTALCFEVTITILAWSTFDVASISGPSLGSFITKHSLVLIFLLADFSVARLPAPAHTIVWPFSLFLIYVFAAGMYTISIGKTPYNQLNGNAGAIVGGIFIALAIILGTFIILFFATRLRTKVIDSRKAANANATALNLTVGTPESAPVTSPDSTVAVPVTAMVVSLENVVSV